MKGTLFAVCNSKISKHLCSSKQKWSMELSEILPLSYRPSLTESVTFPNTSGEQNFRCHTVHHFSRALHVVREYDVQRRKRKNFLQ